MLLTLTLTLSVVYAVRKSPNTKYSWNYGGNWLRSEKMVSSKNFIGNMELKVSKVMNRLKLDNIVRLSTMI